MRLLETNVAARFAIEALDAEAQKLLVPHIIMTAEASRSEYDVWRQYEVLRTTAREFLQLDAMLVRQHRAATFIKRLFPSFRRRIKNLRVARDELYEHYSLMARLMDSDNTGPQIIKTKL